MKNENKEGKADSKVVKPNKLSVCVTGAQSRGEL